MFLAVLMLNDLMGKETETQVATFAMSLLTCWTIWQRSTSCREVQDGQGETHNCFYSAQKVAALVIPVAGNNSCTQASLGERKVRECVNGWLERNIWFSKRSPLNDLAACCLSRVGSAPCLRRQRGVHF